MHLRCYPNLYSILIYHSFYQSSDLQVHGSLSVLLDSSLCAMAPLLFLTSSVPQLDVIPPEVKVFSYCHCLFFMH